MSCLENAKTLYQMMDQGNMMEAFEKFYHDDVVVIDGNTPPRNGKDAQRKAIEGWLSMVKEVHGGGTGPIAVDEKNNVVMIESWMDVTFQDGNRMKMEEVAVQKWEGDKIIHERFYYTMPGQE